MIECHWSSNVSLVCAYDDVLISTVFYLLGLARDTRIDVSVLIFLVDNDSLARGLRALVQN